MCKRFQRLSESFTRGGKHLCITLAKLFFRPPTNKAPVAALADKEAGKLKTSNGFRLVGEGRFRQGRRAVVSLAALTAFKTMDAVCARLRPFR